MAFVDQLKSRTFWKRTLQVSLVFFVILIILSLLLRSFSALIRFDWATVAEQNFTEGKWQWFFFTKAVVSLVYGIWVGARSTR